MIETLKPVAITKLEMAAVSAKLGVEFKQGEEVLGPVHIAKSADADPVRFQVRIYENSRRPSTEIMLPLETARKDLNEILTRLDLTRDDLYWIHPRAGGTLRRHVVDTLHANLASDQALMQILVGPRQVGKTTAVRHFMKEWSTGTHYANADGVVAEYGPWLEEQWQQALLKGNGTLLVLDEIQKIANWQEHVKSLWDRTRKRGLKVVLLGSSSLAELLVPKKTESLAGRFQAIFVPHWSYPETREAFNTDLATYSRYGGYPKAMEFAGDSAKWFEYIGMSIINPIIDVDIYQQGNFRDIDNLRRAFRVFCQAANTEINYKRELNDIQNSGNVDIVKRYLKGYFDTFLMSPVPLVDNHGNMDPRKNPVLMLNCPAVYTFGRNDESDVMSDPIRFKHAVTSELYRLPHTAFGYWEQDPDTGMDLFIRTTDNTVFGVMLESGQRTKSKGKSMKAFRKTFKDARIASVTRENYADFVAGQRAFLENGAI